MNGAICFVIRDLENFRFSTEITVFPFFRKIEFFPGFTNSVRRKQQEVGGGREKRKGGKEKRKGGKGKEKGRKRKEEKRRRRGGREEKERGKERSVP